MTTRQIRSARSSGHPTRKTFRKKDYPVSDTRRYLEPGPVVLVSSAWQGKMHIMTMGWHMIMEFTPSLLGCYIWNRNYSSQLIRKGKECVINLPTTDLVNEVVGIGNCTGADTAKFEKFGLTAIPGRKVGAPLIQECYANFECRLADASQTSRYNLFIWEVVKAHVATSPKYPETLHYRGNGVFMISGRSISLRRRFRPEDL